MTEQFFDTTFLGALLKTRYRQKQNELKAGNGLCQTNPALGSAEAGMGPASGQVPRGEQEGGGLPRGSSTPSRLLPQPPLRPDPMGSPPIRVLIQAPFKHTEAIQLFW